MDLEELSSLIRAAKIEKMIYIRRKPICMYTHIFSMNIQLFFNEEKNDNSMILMHRNIIPGIDTGCIHQINDSGHCVINEKKLKAHIYCVILNKFVTQGIYAIWQI